MMFARIQKPASMTGVRSASGIGDVNVRNRAIPAFPLGSDNFRLWLLAAVIRMYAATLYVVVVYINRIGTE
ncbi:MAG: hypothetical protein A3G18_04055 [Rhodospirillales bacterium RIFCSPLOWO2_12_FULL_58_28]|nr:MAG: hypothetical protein A3H92_04935 [Rhodospirillales bacterium RIFCSPLOWO2_02_FULL_58_16]OHC78696.1 MAG: hypothetical protein A3G18_04055 [Rhodospirillales bacterium RIFCSPLOWO2_12_FULL_58_28]